MNENHGQRWQKEGLENRKVNVGNDCLARGEEYSIYSKD